MQDERKLDSDELEVICERDKHPLKWFIVDNVEVINLEAFKTIIEELTQTYKDRNDLLQHTRALENELNIERAQAARYGKTLNPIDGTGNDWFAKP